MSSMNVKPLHCLHTLKKVRSNEVLLLGTYFYSSCASVVIVHGEQEDQVLCLRQWVF